jgi:transposase
MQCKQLREQNQRIERITPATLVVGIDIAKEKHAAHAVNFRGIAVSRRAIIFSNSQSGFESLLDQLRQLQTAHGLRDVLVGMESTGHYWFNLAHWLQDHGVDVVMVNPMTTKRNKENRDNSPSKSDAKDALVIADVVSRGYYTAYHRSEVHFHRLRVLVTNRERWVVESQRIQTRMRRWLDIRFPEFTSVFSDIVTPRALATLRRFPAPQDVRALSAAAIVAAWQESMARGGGARGHRAAEALKEAAARSIGDVVGIDEDKWELQHLLDSYAHARRVVAEADARLGPLLANIPGADLLRSVGITQAATAAILAFGGDLRRLTHGDQLLRKAGLNLAERTSGKYKGHIKLSKRGNALLRKHLFFTVIHLIGTNPAFGAWHEENVQVKRMTPMRSVMKLIRKLARLLVAMARTGQPFQPARAEARVGDSAPAISYAG